MKKRGVSCLKLPPYFNKKNKNCSKWPAALIYNPLPNQKRRTLFQSNRSLEAVFRYQIFQLTCMKLFPPFPLTNQFGRSYS